jgi:hypothetical protein
MGGRVEIFQAFFAPCEMCGSIIRGSVRASGKLELGKKPPKFPRFCASCFSIVKVRKRREQRENGTR